MRALVVYESLWGNTAAVARAIAEGIGPEARAVPTDAVSPEGVADFDLVVAGAPVFAFGLPTETIRERIAHDEADAPVAPDLSHPSLRSWLDALPHGTARTAAFETRIWWSPRGATGDIEQRFRKAGYVPIAKAKKFVVKDKYGPLREGELDRARAWGEELSATTEEAYAKS
jgi:flavodoxin